MRLQSQASLDLWDRMERIRTAMGLEIGPFADRLGLKQVTYRRLQSQKADLPVHSIFTLLKEVHVSLEKFESGEIDYDALSAQFLKGPLQLPERYSKNAFSRVRTSVNLLAFVEKYFGWQEKEVILRSLQVRPDVFYDHDRCVSAHLSSDICQKLAQRGYSAGVFFEMGAYSVEVNRHEPLGMLLSGVGNARSLYEIFEADIVSRFDRNSTYRLTKISKAKATFEIKVKSEAADALGSYLISNRATCIQRSGMMASLPCFVGPLRARLKETACIYKGDPSCIYEFDFEEAERAMRLSRGLPKLRLVQ